MQGAAGQHPRSDGSFGALLRAFRYRAYLSQEQLAARAELSERTVRNLEADRVRSPRHDTVRLLADALALTKPEQETWVAAAWGANGRQAEAGLPGAGGTARLPRRVIVAVLTGDAHAGSGPAITWLIGRAGQTLLVVHCVGIAGTRGQIDAAGRPARPKLPHIFLMEVIASARVRACRRVGGDEGARNCCRGRPLRKRARRDVQTAPLGDAEVVRKGVTH